MTSIKRTHKRKINEWVVKNKMTDAKENKIKEYLFLKN